MYLWQPSTEIGHELVTDLDLPFEFEIPEDKKEKLIEVLVPLSRCSEALIKLKLTSQKLDLRVRKISTCLKTFVQYFVDRRSEERKRLHSKHIITDSDVLMTSVGTNTIFEANTLKRIPSNVPPTGKTKYMSISNQIQIKVTFERSRHNVMIMKDNRWKKFLA
ncbi:hypothetical protein GLOIN_2v1487494 [Rhizophagus clarus]|uniref:Uncharacterized protein n=1 Tax=Rhizophagus clarus TaxID=94130 RepID=A0A8H3QKY6_9GLOM|nr:hypothetical protein GLOIN_2v1487494 [Rhizophagus clarus]